MNDIRAALWAGAAVVIAMVIGFTAAVISGRDVSTLSTFFGIVLVQGATTAALTLVRQVKTEQKVDLVAENVNGNMQALVKKLPDPQ